MRIIVTFLASLLVGSAVCAAPIKSLEEGLASPWESLTVALAVGPGCIGILTPVELILCRKGDEITLLVRKTDDRGNYIYSPRRVVSAREYKEMMNTLSGFFERAKAETDLNEYFGSLPDEQRERELEEYVKRHGQPIGGFPSTYVATLFEPGTWWDSAVMNAFAEDQSVSEYTTWIFSYLKEI